MESLCRGLACRLRRSVGEPLGIDGGFTGRHTFLQFVVEPNLDGISVEIVVEAPARWQGKSFLDDSRNGSTCVGRDGNSIEGNSKIVSCYLKAFMVSSL